VTKEKKKVTRRLLAYLRPYLGYAFVGTLSLIALALTALYLPILLGQGLIDQVLSDIGTATGLVELNRLALVAIGLYVLRGILNYTQHFCLSYVGSGVVRDLREDLFKRLLYLPLEYHHKARRGEVISRVTNDINVVQNAVGQGLGEFFNQIVTGIGILVITFYLHPYLALVAFLVLPLISLTIFYLGKKIRTLAKQIQARLADISALLQEVLAGIRIIKAYGAEKREYENLKSTNQQAFNVNIKAAGVMALVLPVIEIISITGILTVIWYGSKEVIAGRLTAGTLVTFIGYLGMSVSPITSLSRLFGVYQQALASSERIFELMDEEKEAEVEEQKELEVTKGQIEFRNVSFSYEKEIILSDVSFTISPGEVVAIVGPSGSGKTTIANLIMRFYHPQEGKVLIDGQDLTHVTLRSLRRQIGLVPQETFLFSGTIFDSIAYGKAEASKEKVSLDEVIWAAQKANAHEFIEKLPLGYFTPIGEEGVNLSGGQRQRIALARAIIRQPRILILDEATSALDLESERVVQEAFESLQKGRTSLVIAHRLSTIKKADKIIVLKDGHIAEIGTHTQLLQAGGLYYRLYHGLANKEDE